MTKKVISLYKCFLSCLIALLGFISCSKMKEKEEIRVAYGTPYSILDIKAKIVDASGNSVSGVKLRIRTEVAGSRDGGLWWTPGHDFLLNKKSDSLGAIDTSGTFYCCLPRMKETYFVYYSKDNPELGNKYANDSVKITPIQTAEKESWFTGAYKLEGTLKLRDNPKKE